MTKKKQPQIEETRNEKRNRLRREKRAAARQQREAVQAPTILDHKTGAFVGSTDPHENVDGVTPIMMAAYDFERACLARDAADVAVVEAEEALQRARDAADTAHTAVRGFRSTLASAIGAVDKLAHEAVK